MSERRGTHSNLIPLPKISYPHSSAGFLCWMLLKGPSASKWGRRSFSFSVLSFEACFIPTTRKLVKGLTLSFIVNVLFKEEGGRGEISWLSRCNTLAMWGSNI